MRLLRASIRCETLQRVSLLQHVSILNDDFVMFSLAGDSYDDDGELLSQQTTQQPLEWRVTVGGDGWLYQSNTVSGFRFFTAHKKWVKRHFFLLLCFPPLGWQSTFPVFYIIKRFRRPSVAWWRIQLLLVLLVEVAWGLIRGCIIIAIRRC